MEPDQEKNKHRCKICSRTFSSGRSLGGHMRSHSEEKEKFERSGGHPSMGFVYGLRQNPKKTFRHSDIAIGEDLAPSSKPMKECGEEFSSLKSLFGHVRRHSESVQAEENNSPRFPIPQVPKRRRRSKRASPASGTDYELEQEDVAIILMMLSCDKNFYDESGDKFKKWKKRAVPQTSRIHACDICARVFSSGQALGGHKRSHLVPFVGDEGTSHDQQTALFRQISEPLDLNLPAPQEEESDVINHHSIYKMH